MMHPVFWELADWKRVSIEAVSVDDVSFFNRQAGLVCNAHSNGEERYSCLFGSCDASSGMEAYFDPK
jgi:hypothetical protein